MNVVLCEYAEKRAFTAGNKARTDTVKILVRNGFKHIPLFESKRNKCVIFSQMVKGSLSAIRRASVGDTVFIQYPYYPFIVNSALMRLLCLGRRIRHYRIQMLIHDSMGLRNIKNDKSVMAREIRLFNRADVVISHNEKMTGEFVKAGGNTTFVELGPFDYLYEDPVGDRTDTDRRIVVAGNLSQEKSGYIYLLDTVTTSKFNLYGLNFCGKEDAQISYKGLYPPEELVSQIKGDYGLVWDGESPLTCEGVYGEYLRYNNPHKFSMYLAAGIPVIVWSESALADYVREQKIGLCIASLADLDERLDSVSEQEYRSMMDNVMRVREELVAGRHLTKCLAVYGEDQ